MTLSPSRSPHEVPAAAPLLRRDWVGTALWSVSFGAASCFLVLVALLAALA